MQVKGGDDKNPKRDPTSGVNQQGDQEKKQEEKQEE